MINKEEIDTSSLISKLKASEERLQLALEASQTGIWEWNVSTGELVWSKQVKIAFGLKPTDDITYEKYRKLLHPDDHKKMEQAIENSKRTGKNYNVEHRVIWPDGSVHWIQGQGKAYLKDGKAERIAGTVMLIDTRKTYEIALQKSEERLALALKAANMGTWEWNLTTGELLWSKELKELFGLKHDDDITYEKYLSLLHPEDTPRVTKVIEKALEDGRPYTIEDRVVWPDGSVHWLQRHGQAFIENGKATRMVGISMNIDRRKQSEIEMHESEQRFRNLADVAPVLIWVAGPDKLLTFFNKIWIDFTGRKPGQDLGEGWEEVIHPDDLGYCKSVYFTAFDNREPYRMEYRVRRHDGKYLWMLDKGAPRYSPEGEFLGFVGSMIEVEEIRSTKKRQQELEEINLKLKQQQKQLVALNNSKDEFISVASHQLRTPATGVKQYIGMLLQGYAGELSKEQLKMLQTAYESNERQLRIIDDLLKVAHVDAGKVTLSRSKTDLVDLIDEIIDEQADKFKHKRQGMSFRHRDQQVFAMIDPERMRMVIENLIDNASKYTTHGKNVIVELSQTTDEVTIRVTDEGIGIAKKDISQLFQKFSRLDNVLSTLVGGTGLGLYWVKKIVILHKGTISVESEPDKGSTFTVVIPRYMHKETTE